MNKNAIYDSKKQACVVWCTKTQLARSESPSLAPSSGPLVGFRLMSGLYTGLY